jgi:hypothetical protein
MRDLNTLAMASVAIAAVLGVFMPPRVSCRLLGVLVLIGIAFVLGVAAIASNDPEAGIGVGLFLAWLVCAFGGVALAALAGIFIRAMGCALFKRRRARVAKQRASI